VVAPLSLVKPVHFLLVTPSPALRPPSDEKIFFGTPKLLDRGCALVGMGLWINRVVIKRGRLEEGRSFLNFLCFFYLLVFFVGEIFINFLWGEIGVPSSPRGPMDKLKPPPK